MIFYEGYQFLASKQVWTCRRLFDDGHLEPMWQCTSDNDQIRNYPVSQISIYPQVMSTPQYRGQDPAAGHPGQPGTRGRYTRGCRCDQCKAANAAYMKRRRKQDRND